MSVPPVAWGCRQRTNQPSLATWGEHPIFAIAPLPPLGGSTRRSVLPMADGRSSPEPVRLAELLAALSLGIDLGFGQPMEHVLRQCQIALRIAELAGLTDETRAGIYYAALLVNVGCHTDAHEQAHWTGDDIAMK